MDRTEQIRRHTVNVINSEMGDISKKSFGTKFWWTIIVMIAIIKFLGYIFYRSVLRMFRKEKKDV